MIPLRREISVKFFKLVDILILALCFLLTTALVNIPFQKLPLDQYFTMRVTVKNAAIIICFIFTWNFIFTSNHLYVSRRISSIRAEVIDILRATTIGALALLVASILFHIRMVNGLFVVAFWQIILVITVLERLALRYGLRQFRVKGVDLRNVVIAGVHERAMEFVKTILSKPELGYKLVGFVDDTSQTAPEFEQNGYRLVADFESFPEFIRNHDVDEVIICLPVKSLYQQASRIALMCEEHGITVRVLSDIFTPRKAHSVTHQFEGHSVVTYETNHMEVSEILIKRFMDVLISLTLILILLPILIVVAVLIKTSSKGPILFVQKRLGLNKHHFNIYKFRTMYCDAEKKQTELEHLNEAQGPVFKIKDDPRITRIGKFLRRTSIDELPQLFNVVKGEMSLVGPRPLPIRDYEGFDKDWHRRRFSVRPGITCLWQISGRSNMSFDQWMELDMEYIDKQSIWMDIAILLKTVPAVLKGSGAM